MSVLPMRAHRTFAAEARSVAQARTFVRAKLDEWDALDLVDSATLLVSELVTNAVVHTGTTSRLDLRLEPSSLRIEVEDRHPGRALPRLTEQPPEESEQGRGLLITAALASAWGVEYTAQSKRVWVLCERGDGTPRGAPALVATPAHADGERARVAVVEVAADGELTAWNQDATALFGWSASEVLGRTLGELVDPIPGERPPTEPTAPGAQWQGSYLMVRKGGSPLEVFASHLTNGTGDGAVLLLVPAARRGLLENPVSTPKVARTEIDPLGLRDDALLRLGVGEYLALAVERVRDTLSADASYLLLSHDFGEDFEVVALSGLPDSLRGIRLAPGSPGATDARTPQLPVVVSDISEFGVPLLADTDLRSLVVVPVAVEGTVIGALAVASEGRHGFSHDEAVLLQRLADSLAFAADRARLRASERERRGWLSFIADAGDLLAGSLDADMTMAMTGQIVVPRIARWCALHLDDERGRPVLQQVWHEDERKVEELRAALLDMTPTQILDGDANPFADSMTTIPLIARGRQIGYLTLGRAADDPLGNEFFLVAQSIARRAALAIDNARAHGDLQAVGQALQESLLPATMPTAPGLDVGVVYEAAGEGAAAGGDFYDLFPVGGGTWCFVVGDVCGTGAEAAAVTGLARHTIQALVRAGFPVGATLERLNTAILDEGPRSRFLTLVCGTLQHTGGKVRLSMVNAGHPPPFVVGAAGGVRQLGTPQPLLGVVDRLQYTPEELTLDRGDLLVVVTDGVLERRDLTTDHMLDESGLAAELRRVGRLPAQAVAEQIRRLVVDFTDEPQRDDMAILAIRMELAAGMAPSPTAEEPEVGLLAD
jgi:serine phosphatase RsbU (regulator of sigma subunit)/anti-sigma regulatory factor (Ser/Thr protein kinase)